MTSQGVTTVLAEAARTGGWAPSVHNTQPWRWRVHPRQLDLYADRSRQLAAADPDGRLLTLSCGAALHHARLALAAAGWQARVERLPDPNNPDHLARLHPGDRVDPSAETVRRFQAMDRRRTDRRPVVGGPVPPDTLEEIRAAVEAEGAHLHLLRTEQVSELAVAARRAHEQSTHDPALREELAYWISGPHPPGTGLVAAAIPREPSHATVPVRDFGGPGDLPVGERAAGGDRGASYVLLFGPQDTPVAWLHSGEALSAAWLAATARAVAVLPFSAVVELPATRAVLWRLLAGLGHPYLVLRLSSDDPEHPAPRTPRLDPDEIIEFVDGAR